MQKNPILAGETLNPLTYHDTPAAISALVEAAKKEGVTSNELIRTAVRAYLLQNFTLRFATLEDELDWGRPAPIGRPELLEQLRARELQNLYTDDTTTAEVEDAVDVIEQVLKGKRPRRR